MARKQYDSSFGTAPLISKRTNLPINALFTPKQIAVLKSLHEHRSLTAQDIHALNGGDITNLYLTLKILRSDKNEYIRIIPQHVEHHNICKPRRYELTGKGVTWLHKNLNLPEPSRINGTQYKHNAMAEDIMVQFKVAIADTPGARLISWKEIKAQLKKNTSIAIPVEFTHHNERVAKKIIPDANIFGFEIGPKTFYLHGIEAQTGTQSMTSHDADRITMERKFRADLAIPAGLSEAMFKLPHLYRAYKFKLKGQVQNALDLLSEITEGKGSRFILIQGPDQHPFFDPWHRVGHRTMIFYSKGEVHDDGRESHAA